MTHENRSRITVDLAGAWQHYSPVLPVGYVAHGTVQRGTGETGALVLSERTGIYLQANAGVMRSLDQSKVKAALGKSA